MGALRLPNMLSLHTSDAPLQAWMLIEEMSEVTVETVCTCVRYLGGFVLMHSVGVGRVGDQSPSIHPAVRTAGSLAVVTPSPLPPITTK